jgi:hypothetical protein
MISDLGWGTFLLWGIFDLVIAVLAFLFLKETKGLSLEIIAHQRFKKGSTADDLEIKLAVDHEEERIDGPSQ